MTFKEFGNFFIGVYQKLLIIQYHKIFSAESTKFEIFQHFEHLYGV